MAFINDTAFSSDLSSGSREANISTRKNPQRWRSGMQPKVCGSRRRRLWPEVALVVAMAFTSACALAQAEDPALRLGQPTRLKLMLDTENPQQVWTAVMKAVGSYDKPGKCWTLTAGGRRFCMRPAKMAIVTITDSRLYLFAVSGHEYEPASLAGGVVLFLSFATNEYKKGFRSEGVDGLYEFGARGAPPADSAFKLVEAGMQTYAWDVADTFISAGSRATRTTLIHAAGRYTPRRKVLASFESYQGDQSGCGAQAGAPCGARQIDYVFKPGVGALHDLEMTLSAKTDASLAIRSEPVTISFDAAAGQYKTPGQNMIEWLARRPAAKLAARP